MRNLVWDGPVESRFCGMTDVSSSTLNLELRVTKVSALYFFSLCLYILALISLAFNLTTASRQFLAQRLVEAVPLKGVDQDLGVRIGGPEVSLFASLLRFPSYSRGIDII